MRSVKSLKGFKNDKRNLLEASNNLIVFGEGQQAEEATRGRRRLHHVLRRRVVAGDNRSSAVTRSRSASRTREPPAFLVPGPGSALRRLDHLTQMDVMSNYFLDTKPWKQASQIMKFAGTAELPGKEKNAENESSSLTPNLLSKSPSQMLQQSESSSVGVHVCPVCSKGFEPSSSRHVPVAEFMRHSMASYQKRSSVQFRKNLEDGWGVLTKPKCNMKPQDVVVSANCGELFHKICLRDWCSRGHKLSPRTLKPITNCPSCAKELKYTVCQDIDTLRSFSSEPTAMERELIQTKLVNKELQLLWPETSSYLARLQNDIKDAETLYKQLKSKKRTVKTELKKLTAEDLSVVMSKVTDVGTMKVMLEKQEKALEFMQQETLQIMRMYLLTVIRKNKSPVEDTNDNVEPLPVVAPLSDKIPSELSPHMQNILNDDHSLHLLSRIIAPMPEEANDEAKRKLLEFELLQKYIPTDANKLGGTSTYTVFSSEAEVGDTETESVGKMEEFSELQKCSMMPTDEEKMLTILKGVTGMHKLPAERMSSNGFLLQPKPLSERNFLTGKPTKLFEIEEINSANGLLKINSSAGSLTRKREEKKTLNDKSDSEMEDNYTDVEEDDDEATKEEPDYISPLMQFPLPSSFKPVQWLSSNGEELRRSSSMEVSAMSIAHRLQSAGKDELSEKEQERRDEDVTITNVQEGPPFGGRMEVNEAIRHFLDQSSEKEAASEPQTKVEEDLLPITPTTNPEAEDDNVSWTTVSGDEEERPLPTHSSKDQQAPPLTGLSSSCELVFRAKASRQGKKAKPSRQINMCQGQVPVHSDCSQTSVPEQQVSIAIMYIIDDDDEDDVEVELEGSSSGSEMGEFEIFTKSTPAPDSTPSPKVLTPVFMNAQKTSNYSLIASQKSSSISSSPDADIKISQEFLRKREQELKLERDNPASINDPLEHYRPPCISSWPQGIHMDNKAFTLPASHHQGHNSDNPVNYYLREVSPKGSLACEQTTMFYENEMSDKLMNERRVPSK